MTKSHKNTTNLSSCIIASTFLTLLLLTPILLYFTLLKPEKPRLSVTAIQLPTFSVSNSTSTVNFTFSQYVTIHNPNHAVLAHYDSSLQLLYSGNQVGFMFIPAGKIGPGRTQYMSATFNVKAFPLMPEGEVVSVGPDGPTGGFRAGPSLEIESRIEMAGRVRVFHFFSHHVESLVTCRVVVGVRDGSVLGFRC